MKIHCIVQARMNSSRLPNKVLKKIGNFHVIELLIKRLSLSKLIDKIAIVTSKTRYDDILVNYLDKIGQLVIRGSENNLLKRYYKAQSILNSDIIIRVTGDCPFIDPYLIDNMIEFFLKNKFDYISNTNPPTYPDGLDVEIFTSETLKVAYQLSKNKNDLEHVTPFILKSSKFKKYNFKNKIDYSNYRWTLDEPIDLVVLNKLFSLIREDFNFFWKDIIKHKSELEKINLLNSNINRNEGQIMGSGQKYWKRAKKVIPGGTMLLSKRPDQFHPEKWPSYFSKAKDCFIWDLDNKKYLDMCIMGIGTNILGYGNKEIDNAVINCVKNGNMSTLNAPDEINLAEKLIELHPWAQKVRFARTGGEANAIAVRIARAASGKDKIAICGYHGWHDWYLSVNLKGNNELEDHLLPGLEPNGVPKGLIGSVLPFKYNDYKSFNEIILDPDLAAVKMEVARNDDLNTDFLKHVRQMTKNNNVALIFDECTSGFRQALGGIHKVFEINPDILILGKALGNGYAITSVLGKEEIMDYAQSTFISSTFWTERIGSVAALKTIEIMEEKRSWEKITEIGKNIKNQWKNLSKKYGINITISGIDALPSFTFNSKDHLKYKTYITEKMLEDSILATTTIYVSTEHHNNLIETYIEKLDKIFKKISDFENGENIDNYLKTVCSAGFSRLN